MFGKLKKLAENVTKGSSASTSDHLTPHSKEASSTSTISVSEQSARDSSSADKSDKDSERKEPTVASTPPSPAPPPSPKPPPSPVAPTPEPQTARSGLLTLRIVECKGLKASTIPAAVQKAIKAHGGTSVTIHGGGTSGSLAKRSGSLKRKKIWWMPYIVANFDKNDVVVEPLGGEMEAPVFMFRTHFDVSRDTDLTLTAYLRSSDTSTTNDNDLFIGSVVITPDLTATKVSDHWYPATSGNGNFHLQVAFKAMKEKLSMDDFDLLRVIGKGSFGKVMQVRKRDTGRIYALKTIRKAHIVSRSEVTHTLAERSVLAQVNNPFITPLKFAFQSPDKLYLVLAFMNGGELFHHLQKEGRFSEERSRFYAGELLCALECLHGFNVIYRDLKPENILLDYTGHISLCDFGLCKLNMTDTETTTSFVGTPEYLAPELLMGKAYTKMVDWWTLGVLLYEMLTGLPPYYDEDIPTMYKKIVNNPLKFPDWMSEEAKSILTGLLNRDPNKRLGRMGAQQIRDHDFFAKHIIWDDLIHKRIQPPFKPSVENVADTSNFDEEFVSERPVDSVVEKSSKLSESVQAQFAGFTFQNQNLGPQSVRDPHTK